MAQNVPTWQVPPGGYGSVFNAGATDIPANLCLVPDSAGDRAAKVPTAGTIPLSFGGVTVRAIKASANLSAGAQQVGDVACSTGDIAVCTASGSITRGDVVYIDSTAGKLGYVKTYAGSGAQMIVGIAQMTAIDSDLVEVRLVPFFTTGLTAASVFQDGALRTVRGVATSNIILATNGLAVIDGVTPVAGDRWLLTAQTTGSQNGIYVASAGAWAYAPDWSAGLVYAEMLIAVSEGTLRSHSIWRVATTGAITIGTTATSIVQAFDAGQSIDPKVRCVGAAGNVNLATIGLGVVDGVTVLAGDRVLLTTQTSGPANGVYIASAGTWALAPDYVQGQVKSGQVFEASEGTTFAGSSWKLTTAQVSVGGYITVGTTTPAFYPRVSQSTGTLVNGSLALTALFVGPAAKFNVVPNGAPVNPGFLRVSASASVAPFTGTATVTSSSGTDASPIALQILNF